MHARKTIPLLTLLLGLALTSLALAGSALDSFSLGLEKEIGRGAYQQVLAERKTARLPRSQAERLSRIFARLTPACSRAGELEFTLTAIEESSINAFALPGGYIFVHDRLLAFAANDGELAGVLAHEIAHVDRRHGMKAVYRSVGMSLLLEIVVNKSDPRRRERMAKIGAATVSLTILGYGREAEYEADRYAVTIMRQAGYDKRYFADFLRRLARKSGSGKDPALKQLLSTHPPLAERIKRIEGMTE